MMMPAWLLALLGITQVRADASSYGANAVCANDQLMRWYDSDAGVWNDNNGNPYWWQSANMMTAFNDLAMLNQNAKIIYSGVWESTYKNAPATNPSPSVIRGPDGRLQKVYTPRTPEEVEARRHAKRDEVGFTNHFYDDEGWWALAWVGALDNTGKRKYLDEAIGIWYDMNEAWNRPACGGLPWNKDEGSGPLAIENEIYIQLSAALANRVGDDQKDIFLNAAKEAWDWFQKVGLINSDNLINDGVDTNTCKNNGDTAFSYNQGVIIGGLVELYHATGEESYLDKASDIADAVTRPGSQLLTDEGILVDVCDRNGDCGGDGVQFKGVFTRNLSKLLSVRQSDQWVTFLETNAQSIWTNSLKIEDNRCKVGVYWGGPYTDADASSQSSGLDCLVAAFAATF